MGKSSDLSDFERGMIVGARRAGATVSETAAFLGFSRTTVSRVYREWCNNQKTSSQRQSCGRKLLVDERGRRRMERIVQADSQATCKQIMAQYNSGVQTGISERTTRRSLSRMGFYNRPPRVISLSSENNKKPLEDVSVCQTREEMEINLIQ